MTAVITRDRDWYLARWLQVEVTTQGRSVEEATDNLTEVLKVYFADDASVPPTVGSPSSPRSSSGPGMIVRHRR